MFCNKMNPPTDDKPTPPIEPFVIKEGTKTLEGRNFESAVLHQSVGVEGDVIVVVVVGDRSWQRLPCLLI